MTKSREMEGSNSTESYDVSPSENLVVRTGESFLEAQPSHAIPYIGMTIIALTVGSVGNLVIVGCFAISKALSKVGNEFLFNMALSDLCVTAVAEPMCILGKWTNHLFCKSSKLEIGQD